jgi:uncharacterized iron-regulated protein
VISIITALLFSVLASASEPIPTQEGIFSTRTRQWLTVDAVAAEIGADTIVVFGEQHATSDTINDKESILHHANQLRWLKALNLEGAKRKFAAHLGMEFITYPNQTFVDQFLNGNLSEEQFLKNIEWGSNPFEPYKRLLLESIVGAGTVALNIPKSISRAVAKDGPNSLTQEQRALLPPIWERGSIEYFERFKEVMNGHVSGPKLENYFWSQSLWDDTMAWQALENPRAGPMTIVVGEFHVEFGHGLPARLKRQGAKDVRTMLQVAVDAGDSFDQAVASDPKYGEHADYIWVFRRD